MKKIVKIAAIITLVAASNSNAGWWEEMKNFFNPRQPMYIHTQHPESDDYSVTLTNPGVSVTYYSGEIGENGLGKIQTKYIYPRVIKYLPLWQKLVARARKNRYQRLPEQYDAYAKQLVSVSPHVITTDSSMPADSKTIILGGTTYELIPTKAYSSQAKKAFARTQGYE